MQKHVILREIQIMILNILRPKWLKKELFYNEENDHSGFVQVSDLVRIGQSDSSLLKMARFDWRI